MLVAAIASLGPSAHAIRIKDVTHIQGIRDNQLIGYGIVVGLNGTGDGSSSSFTAQSLSNFLSRNNVEVDPDDITLKNVAAVIITATLPPFARKGDKIDVLVSSIGDASSLQGGTLVMTPLHSATPGFVFAVAQGPILLGGFGASSGGTSVSKNHVTAGRIPGGALVEREPPIKLDGRSSIHLILESPDYTTAQRIADVINFNLGPEAARALTAAEVEVKVPEEYRGRLTEFLASIERLPVHPDQRARVVVDERTGTVVMGEDVRISTLALAHGSLTIQITEVERISQPEAFSEGTTTAFSETGVSAQEENRELAVIEEGVSLGEVVRSLNAIGVTPRDLIAILQAMRTLGALQAELIIQ